MLSPFDQFLKTELNAPQRKAVLKKSGATLVVAGAGSGKTRVITARIANLILNQKVDPSSIVALTFTNKAALEMKARITKFVGITSKLTSRRTLPFVGTFHAYALLLLRKNSSLLPFADFSIIDEDDQRALLKKILKRSGLEKQISATQLKHQISKAKNQLDGAPPHTGAVPLKELFLAYETEKAQAHSFDFDDLLLTILRIFQNNNDFKKRFQSRIKHILVDEYQDTNGVQHELLKEMSLNDKKKFVLESLCAVGDEDQSIYSWRGAKVTNMLSFREDFAPVKIIKIEQNYRSVQQILKAANSVIEQNKQRHPKKLWSEKKGRDRILHITCQSGYQEADAISSYLKALPQKTKLKDIAILYRTHFQSRTIEESLIKNSIPYIIVGGIRFYERREIKDLLAYLRLVVNPFDRLSLFRIINRPARGLGAKFEELLYKEWNNNNLFDFKQILNYLIEEKKFKVTSAKKNSIKKFLEIFENLASRKEISKSKKSTEILNEIIEKTDYLLYLRNAHDPHEADAKIENVHELARSVEKYKSLENFLYEVALLQEKLEKDKEKSDHVQMMTLHAAKGLEFDTVIITGLEEGLLPSTKSLHDSEAIEEERRLFYVGITRAMQRLVLFRSIYRNTYGQVNDQVISRFLTEIPSKYINHIDMTAIHPAKIKTLLAQWLGSKLTFDVTTFGGSSIHHPSIRPLSRTPRYITSATSCFGGTRSERAKSKPVHRKKNGCAWGKNQVVLHKIFGPGIVKKVEKKSGSDYYLTILFKKSEKRILSTFVKAI
jgi:DNA helicase-2/ATP-dependent DNA helicase PcrA